MMILISNIIFISKKKKIIIYYIPEDIKYGLQLLGVLLSDLI